MQTKPKKQTILESKKTEKILWVLILGTFLLSIVLSILTQERRTADELQHAREHSVTEDPFEDYNTRGIQVASSTYAVLLADTPEKRVQGLSDSAGLPDHIDGMLFVFDEPGSHGIWMKDMNYPIDIFWLNPASTNQGSASGTNPALPHKDFEVVYQIENVSPDTYPTVFSSPTPARFVLELPI